MIVHRHGHQLVALAPAKVNLHLEVRGKRADGYHELESLMLSVSLFDVLTVTPRAAGTVIACDDSSAGPVGDNLVSRAVALVRSESGRDDGVAITLLKKIPVAAGLAGGSSDAAVTLSALNELWNLGWTRERLSAMAATLGSDVPFFLGTGAAIARGRGEKLTPLDTPVMPWLVLLCPATGVSTAECFRQLELPIDDAAIARVEPIADAFARGDIAEVGRRLVNRLETPARKINADVDHVARHAARWPCLGQRMSGSGSTWFALCEGPEHAAALADQLRPLNLGKVFVVHGCLND